MTSVEQDPEEKLDYQQTLINDTVASGGGAWDITPSGPTLGSPVNTSTSSKVRVSGLTSGVTYRLKATITGASGQVYVRSINIWAVVR